MAIPVPEERNCSRALATTICSHNPYYDAGDAILEWLIIVTADYGSARLIVQARSITFLQDKRALG